MKPVSLKHRAIWQMPSLPPVAQSAPVVQAQSNRRMLLGESQPMRQLRATIDKLSRSQAAVYINGESGSGKELAARMIHERSARHQQPFIAVNCGAIPENLMESEFFGYKKGAFTGAEKDMTDSFGRPMVEPCFLMKLRICHWLCKSNCCGSSRKNK